MLRRTVANWALSQSAIAAVEFAIVMPVLILFMLAAAEATKYINTSRQITNLANSIALLAAEQTSNIGYNDASFIFNSTMITFPSILQDSAKKGIIWYNDIQLTLSSVVFYPTVFGCTSSCTYNAKVAWSINTPTAATRSCILPPTKAATGSAPSLASLPTDVFQAGSLIVADVIYQYQPSFGSMFVPPLTMKRSIYLQPRYQSQVGFTGLICP